MSDNIRLPFKPPKSRRLYLWRFYWEAKTRKQPGTWRQDFCGTKDEASDKLMEIGNFLVSKGHDEVRLKMQPIKRMGVAL